MHYKNGREAKEGDKIILLTENLVPVAGILHTVQPGATACNGRLALLTPNDPYVTIGECLHIDDVAKADIPDSSNDDEAS